jgi:hypothetical protein
VILLASEISCPQSSEFTIVSEKFVKIAGDDHIQIDVELASRDIHIEQGYFSPPTLPPFL